MVHTLGGPPTGVTAAISEPSGLRPEAQAAYMASPVPIACISKVYVRLFWVPSAPKVVFIIAKVLRVHFSCSHLSCADHHAFLRTPKSTTLLTLKVQLFVSCLPLWGCGTNLGIKDAKVSKEDPASFASSMHPLRGKKEAGSLMQSRRGRPKVHTLGACIVASKPYRVSIRYCTFGLPLRLCIMFHK